MNEKDSTNPTIEEVIKEKDEQKQKDKYNQYVENMTPKNNCLVNCAKAFLVGGTICCIGEGFSSFYQYLGNDKELSSLYATMSLVILSIILTGLNIYQKIGQFGGAGSIVPDLLLNDAVTIPQVEIRQIPIIKGDAKSISIAAASIVAKVTRDRLMVQYDEVFPEYGFASNKGYGAQLHLEALRKYGPSPIHRRSFLKNIDTAETMEREQ